MRDGSTIEIDLLAVDHNLRVIRKIVGPKCAVCPVVKSNAYGLGAARLGQRLAYGGADMLAVYTPDEAAELMNATVGCPVLVMMPVFDITRTDEIYRGLVREKIHLTVHDEPHLHRLMSAADQFGMILPLHLEVDTGMSRGGCEPDEAAAIIEKIANHQRLRLAGLFTHFASPETDVEATDQQLGLFTDLIDARRDQIPADCVIHCAASFAMLRAHRYHRSMVRVGLAWTGYGFEWLDGEEMLPDGVNLNPTITWSSSIVQVKAVPEGRAVGYGSAWRAKRDSILGLIPVGYAHGYPRVLGAANYRTRFRRGGQVAVLDEFGAGDLRDYAPVIGAVNMDQIVIDLTEIVKQRGDVATPGTTVELITADSTAPNQLSALARAAKTCPHEMITRLHPLIRRVYRTEPAPVIVEPRMSHAAPPAPPLSERPVLQS